METFQSGFSVRKCHSCGKVRLLGPRAAAKYPLGYYIHNGEEKRFSFDCNMLFNVTCATSADIGQLDFDDLELTKNYILLHEEDRLMNGGIIQINEIISENDIRCVQYQIGKKVGSLDYMSAPVNGDWINCTALNKWSIGTKVSKFSRFKAVTKNVVKVYDIFIERPHEAVCCTPFYDTHQFTVDPDNPNEKIRFGSLQRVRNIHKLLSSMKIIICTECERNLPGVQNIDNIDFNEESFEYGCSLKEMYKHSEVMNIIDMKLDENFGINVLPNNP